MQTEWGAAWPVVESHARMVVRYDRLLIVQHTHTNTRTQAGDTSQHQPREIWKSDRYGSDGPETEYAQGPSMDVQKIMTVLHRSDGSNVACAQMCCPSWQQYSLLELCGRIFGTVFAFWSCRPEYWSAGSHSRGAGHHTQYRAACHQTWRQLGILGLQSADLARASRSGAAGQQAWWQCRTAGWQTWRQLHILEL